MKKKKLATNKEKNFQRIDAGGLYKLGTMTNSEQNVIFVYIYLDGGLRVGWFCTSTKTAHSYVIQSDASLSIQKQYIT